MSRSKFCYNLSTLHRPNNYVSISWSAEHIPWIGRKTCIKIHFIYIFMPLKYHDIKKSPEKELFQEKKIIYENATC